MVFITVEMVRKKAEHHERLLAPLEEIALHQENIEKIEYLQDWCPKLKILLMQSNLIAKIENLNKLKHLVYLNLALNNIEIIENLERCESLQKLDLTLNFIGEIVSVESLVNLYNLENLYLSGNPCTDYENYRDFVIGTLPQLTYLDGREVERSDRIKALQNLPIIRSDILFEQENYRGKRIKQKNRLEREIREKWENEYKDMDPEERNKKFWKEKCEHSPEVRYEMEKMRNLKLKSLETEEKKEKKRVYKFFTEEGRPYNINQPQLDFLFSSDDPEFYMLDLAVYKHMDTSLIDVDVQPNYVRVIIRGKIFQIHLPEEVDTTNSTAQRSQITGHLVIKMPKSKVVLKTSTKNKKHYSTKDAMLYTEHKIEECDARTGQTKREYLEIGPADNVLDFTKLTLANNKSKPDYIDPRLKLQAKLPPPDFVDNPEINANHDDDGLMVGRYDGEYKDGVAPHAWTGSVAIMERYLTDGGRPVEYGQCWVYSGLVVTICRALGIPCRSVTNYVSAHDTNRTFTVDKYFDRDGNEVPNGPDEDCYDSCWNFHVWNDVWMQRPDLPQGYSGWQIIDSTPQEEAEAVYHCGPASVEAVRRGEVGFQYDTPFMYCQLNAELCHFQEEENSEWGFIRMASNQHQVGRKILTKNPNRDDDEGDSDMLEITHEYKTVDSSSPERLAVIASCRGYQRLQQYYEYPDRNFEDVYFDLMDIDLVPYGQPFDCTMNIQNKSHEDRTIWCVLTASSCYYTGAIASRLRRAQGEFVVRAGQREVLKLHVTPQEYMDKLVDHSMVKVHAMAYVKQTRQAWSDEDDFPLHKPRMQVQVRSQPCIGQECAVTFSFQNPLNVHLTDCYFTFEGPGVQRPRQIRFRDVKPGEFVNYQDKFVPRRHGERRIVVTFSSRQLDEIFGCTTVNVRG